MAITAQIVADSINPKGCRLTSWVLEYPRFIHAEIMTHRVFSKNCASSRAIPTEKIIQAIMDNPAMPVWWGKNQSGMQAKEELDDTNRKSLQVTDGCSGKTTQEYSTDRELAKQTWLSARDSAITHARYLNDIGLHKQIANRILEPWFHMRVILSGTEFENFFALRAHPDAQPEFQALAYKMLELYNASTPQPLKGGEWHIPFGDSIDIQKLMESESFRKETEGMALNLSGDMSAFIDMFKRKIAIARCARVSYHNFEGKDDYDADIKLCDRLFGNSPRHLSPTEHVAQALDSDKFIGNFKGFQQFRYTFADQNLSDPRVKK